ncbi:MAG: hypothetical protein ABIT01_10585, partial [Thermoanaerobaculia bacterium]
MTAAVAAADGSRVMVGTRAIPHGVLVMKPSGAIYDFGGEFTGASANSLAIDAFGSRYLGYALYPTAGTTSLKVADITSFVAPPGNELAGSIASESVPGTYGGTGLVGAGHFLVYSRGDALVVVDGRSPGAVGAISTGLSAHLFTPVDFGLPAGHNIGDFAAAIHPGDGKLYIMVHTKSPSSPYGTSGVALARTSDGVSLSVVGPKLTLAAPWANSAPSSSGTMIATANDLLVMSWVRVSSAGGNDNKLFTWAASNWGVDLTPSVVASSASFMSGGSTLFFGPVVMRGFAQGSAVNLYVGTGEAIFLLSLTCPLVAPPPPVATGLFVLTPCRLLDTRGNAGTFGGPPIPAYSQRQFPAAGSCGIPAGARTLVGNLTVVNPSATGTLRAFAGDGVSPVSSILSFTGGRVRGNNLILGLAGDGSGTLAIRNESPAAADVILDVSGYFE